MHLVHCELCMFCKYCGNSVPEGALHCPMCGAAQAVAPVEATPTEAPVAAPVEATPTEIPVAAPVEAAAPAPAPVAGFGAPNFDNPQPMKPKRSLKKILIPVVAVMSAAAVLLCAFNWGWISTFFTDLFGKPENLRDKVVSDQTETIADAMSSKYGQSVESMKELIAGGKSATATIELIVGDKVENLLSSLGADTDELGVDVNEMIDLIDGSYVTIAGGSEDDVIRAAIQAGLGGKELLNVGAIADLANKELYAAVPMFTDLHLDLSEPFADLIDEVVNSIDVEDIEAMGAMVELLDALPSEETVNKLLTKYIALALAEFDDVSKDKDTLSIGGINEKVTVLETSICEADAVSAAKAVLAEVAKDNDIEKIIVDLVEAVNSIEDTGMTGDEAYEMLVAGVESALEEIDEYEGDTEEVAVVTQYINSSYEVVGLAVEIDGMTGIYFASATKGKNFAFEMEVMGETVMTGEGTNRKGIIDGSFEIGPDGETYVTVNVSGFDKNAFKKGYIKGSFELKPNEELMGELMDEASSMAGSVVSMLDLGIRLDVDTSDEKSTMQVSLTDDGDVLVGIKLTSTITSDEVKVPSPDDTTDDVQEWLESFDFDALFDTLSDLGVPSDLLDEAEDVINDALDELSYSDSYYDSNYDSYYF